ncbi:hypothetical protein [Actinomyces vulturis]|uniref:hypothetical protein n=1 Tax=Actinomyces vulturis TaxID=1857645 RepID=UPI00082AE27D|nr:hypothetical protein [Actinomyces vulturis]
MIFYPVARFVSTLIWAVLIFVGMRNKRSRMINRLTFYFGLLSVLLFVFEHAGNPWYLPIALILIFMMAETFRLGDAVAAKEASVSATESLCAR